MPELKITYPNCFNEEKCFEDVQDQDGKSLVRLCVSIVGLQVIRLHLGFT